MPAIVSNTRVSDLIKDISSGKLKPKPAFQRRLVWTNIVKDHFLETVLLGLPFPEIFIATGDVDTQTRDRTNLLVDGQQRVSTLNEYVQGAKDLVLKKVKPYARLTESEKKAFLDYSVAVRDLGTVTAEEIKEIFARINSTDYALKAMERLNAQYSGEFKSFCETLSQHEFFQQHNVFSLAAWRRMIDIDFCVNLVITMLSTYYHRDMLNSEYLRRYNDSFADSDDIRSRLKAVFELVCRCGFDKKSRIWKRTDLFTAIVEMDAKINGGVLLDEQAVGLKLGAFYSDVDKMFKQGLASGEADAKRSVSQVFRYLKASTKATNDKYSRVERGDIIAAILAKCAVKPKVAAKSRVVRSPRRAKG